MADAALDPVDPRVARTRRDVVDAATTLLLEQGWDGVTHAAVARESGYSKATIYAHWPARLDLVQASIEQICETSSHPPATGDLRGDLRVSLLDFVADLEQGHLDRLLAGVVERSNLGDAVTGLRQKLYDAGTDGMRSILRAHLPAEDVEPSLALLVGAVLVRVSYEGKPTTRAVIDDLVDRVLARTGG